MPIYQPGKDCLVGAGAVVTENKGFTDRSVISGSATKAARVLSEDNVARLRFGAGAYVVVCEQPLSD